MVDSANFRLLEAQMELGRIDSIAIANCMQLAQVDEAALAYHVLTDAKERIKCDAVDKIEGQFRFCLDYLLLCLANELPEAPLDSFRHAAYEAYFELGIPLSWSEKTTGESDWFWQRLETYLADEAAEYDDRFVTHFLEGTVTGDTGFGSRMKRWKSHEKLAPYVKGLEGILQRTF